VGRRLPTLRGGVPLRGGGGDEEKARGDCCFSGGVPRNLRGNTWGQGRKEEWSVGGSSG